MSPTADYDRCTTCVVASAAVAVDVAAVVAADSFNDRAARFGIVVVVAAVVAADSFVDPAAPFVVVAVVVAADPFLLLAARLPGLPERPLSFFDFFFAMVLGDVDVTMRDVEQFCVLPCVVIFEIWRPCPSLALVSLYGVMPQPLMDPFYCSFE